MKRVLIIVLGMAAVIAAEIIVYFVFFYSGVYSVAATGPESEIEEWVFGSVSASSIRRHAPKTVDFANANIEDGEHEYNEMCIVCHGGAKEPKGPIGLGLNPDPPVMPSVVKQFNANEIYWVITNGVKMTGMPAFSPHHSDDIIKSITTYIVQQAPAWSSTPQTPGTDAT
jgi:mono/diheme cytochrome c family protein